MTNTRTIGGRAVHPIGLGCMSISWAYGPPLPEDQGAALLHRALDLGYNHLDTARIYGDGKNEELIGRALAGRRSEFYIASKTGIIIDGDKRRIDCRPETIVSALETSLRCLKTDFIDLYYLHRPDPATPIEESAGALARLIEQGKIGGYGLSEMSTDTVRRAAAVHPVTAVQNEYSPWTRNPEIGLLEACRELGTTFVAFSPVGRGALAGGLRDPSTLAKGDIRLAMPRFSPENWPKNHEVIAEYEAIAKDCGVTPAQLSLSWVLARGAHVVAIPGTSKIAHLEENFARADLKLPAEVIARIDTLMTPGTIVGHRYAEAMRHTVTTEEFA